jgi:hypothetical protein
LRRTFHRRAAVSSSERVRGQIPGHTKPVLQTRRLWGLAALNTCRAVQRGSMMAMSFFDWRSAAQSERLAARSSPKKTTPREVQ